MRYTVSMNKLALLFIITVVFLVLFNCSNPWTEEILQPKTITFDSRGGSYVNSQTVYRDQKIIEPPPPIKSGGTFDGWYVDNETFENEWDFNDIPNQDMTLYANWGPGPWFITGVGVTVTGPATGDTPDVKAPEGGEGYTCGPVAWTPGHDTFQGSTRYTATVTLTANNDYTFIGLRAASINGRTASITNRTESTITLSYTFPATSAKPITGITIRKEPTKMEYTHNDKLDLTGMVVTLTFEDNTTEDVSFSVNNFYNKIITAEPAHGTPLSHSEHNSQPIKVTVGTHTGESARTLTVNKAIPAPVIFPAVEPVIYGRTFSEIPLIGGSGDGTFGWEDRWALPAVINDGYNLVFWPHDPLNYDYSDVEGWDGNKVLRLVQLEVGKATPTADDFFISNPPQTVGSVIPVTITPKDKKFEKAEITIKYGSNNSSLLPQNAGTYAVTFDVKGTDNWFEAANLPAGNLIINKLTPIADDFFINNLEQTAGNVTPVSITPKADKSEGRIIIYYNGLTTLPQNPGTYDVTFDVEDDNGKWSAATGLPAGKLAINTIFESVDELDNYLSGLTANPDGPPYDVVLKIWNDEDFAALKTMLNTYQDKYINLDLSDSTINRIPNNAFSTSTTGSTTTPCTNLVGVTIPDGVESIGYMAFSGCTNLTSVTVSASVSNIEQFAFDNCTNLTSVTFGGSSTDFQQNSFPGGYNLLTAYKGVAGGQLGGGAGTYIRSGTGDTTNPYTWTKH